MLDKASGVWYTEQDTINHMEDFIMKKYLALLLAGIMAISVVSCGNTQKERRARIEDDDFEAEFEVERSSDKEDEDSDSSSSKLSPSVEKKNSASDSDEEDDNTQKPAAYVEKNEDKKTETASSDKKSPSVSSTSKTENTNKKESSDSILPEISESVVLIDNDVCSISLTGSEMSISSGPKLKFAIDNKLSDTNIKVSADTTVVNGYCVSMYINEEVAAGKKANVKGTLYTTDLVKYGLQQITEIELTFSVKDADADYSTPALFTETVTVYPIGTEAATGFTVADEHITNVLVDNEFVKVSSLNFYTKSTYGFCMDVLIENKTNDNIYIAFDNSSVNGYMISGYFNSSYTAPGKNVITYAYWSESNLKENSITRIENLEFDIRVIDRSTYKEMSRTPISLSVSAAE